MAMAEKFIPVKNAKDEIVFSREDYDKIREQMRGLSYYNALSSEEFININDGLRSKDVKLPDGQEADIDITYARKDLKLEYTSDMSVKDRLNSIKKDNPEQYKYVIANIVMEKNILNQMGVYKKVGSDGATEHGGFGGLE